MSGTLPTAPADLYGKYFWTHMTGQDATILGGRFSYAVTETLAPYIGAAWEYEFDGEVRVTTYGFEVPSPSLKGGSGMGEVGLRWTPEKAPGFAVDLSMQGYTGQREGISGTLQLRHEF